jgi:3-oxoacyl-[acyl-carrier protein] reductase
MQLKGKTAVVTGGSRGIGAATADKLAALGSNVAITYSKSPDKAEEVVKKLMAIGVKAKAYKADAEHPEQVASAIANIAKDFGGIDILVNNAGIFEGGVDAGMDVYTKSMNINVLSVIAATLEAVKHMKGWGRIVNVSSILGERGMMPGITSYTMTKFAVNGLTRGWAHDYASRGITVNSVLPGPIDTDMNPNDGGDQSKAMAAMTAIKRYGKPEEVASLIAFLAGPDSTNITGATIAVDGGSNA